MVCIIIAFTFIINHLYIVPTFAVPIDTSQKLNMKQLLSLYSTIDKPIDSNLQQLVSSTNTLHNKTVSPIKIPSTKDMISVFNICYETDKSYPHTQFVCGLYCVDNWTTQKNSFKGNFSLIPYEYTTAAVSESLFSGKYKLFVFKIICKIFYLSRWTF